MTTLVNKNSTQIEENEDSESLLIKSKSSLRKKPKITFSKTKIIILDNESEKSKRMSKGKKQLLVFIGILFTGLFIVGLLALVIFKESFNDEQIDETYANCGQIKIKSFRGKTLTFNDKSENSYPGQWPWIGALHKYLDEEEGKESFEIFHHRKFICSTSLITDLHLLTSATCTFGYKSIELFVLLGHFNLSKLTESSSITRNILTIFAHPEYDPKNFKTLADISVLKMTLKVDFTKFIQPVCFPRMKNIKNSSSSFVVGYRGRNEENFNNLTLEYTKMMTISNEENKTIADNKTFCAKSKTISSFLGNSGEGFYQQIGNAQHFVIIGILTNFQNENCNSKEISTFVNIAEYKDWIIEKISICDDKNHKNCVNPCSLNPCKKNSICEVNSANQHTCVCHDDDSTNDCMKSY